MKAKCINFKKGQKTKEPKYFLYMDGLNKINLEFYDTYLVELIINNEFAAKIDYDNFLENVSDFIYDAITQDDIFEFNFTDIEFYKHFKNVDIKWLEAF